MKTDSGKGGVFVEPGVLVGIGCDLRTNNLEDSGLGCLA